MRKALLAIALAPLLAGCPQLDVLEEKESPHKAAHEQRAALMMEPVNLADGIAPEPAVVAAAVEPPAPPEPECVPVFRVIYCDE